MNQALTFTPDIVVGEDGREHLSVETGTLHTRQGFQGIDVVEYDELTNEQRLLLDENDYSLDEDYETPLDEEYTEAIFEAYPDLENALMWAEGEYTADEIAAYDAAMGTGEPSQMMPLIEALLEDYTEAMETGAEYVEEQEEPITEEQVFEAFEEANQTEPAGMETAYSWMEYAEATQGDEVMSAVAQLTAEFHAGNITAEDAYASALEKYDINELRRVYNYLNK